MSFVLGITGGIATGKSTVVNIFRRFDFPIVDGDVVARKVVEPQTEGLQEVVAEFGTEILNADHSLNRKALGRIVFADDQRRRRLNEILNPFIRKQILAEIAAGKLSSPLVIVDVPLLYEGNYEHYMDAVAVVYLPEELQVQRLMLRDGFDLATAETRIHAQMSIAEKKERADIIFDNQGTPAETEKQVIDWLKNNDFIR
ncbi:dephospho-CoA kinase [Enterococcus sp. LJL120]